MSARHRFPAVRWLCLATLATCVILLACLNLEPGADAAQANASGSLERAFAEQATELLEQFKRKQYKNVGVLKFQVKKGNEQISDNVGPLNTTLAERLQKALILKSSAKRGTPVGIIRNASAVARKIKGANHLEQGECRDKLFDAEYPLAWGNEKVKPDAFVFGTVRLEPSLKDMTVDLFTIDNSNKNVKKCEPVMTFNAPTDVTTLVDAGESFAVRGLFGDIVKNAPPPPPEVYKEKITEYAAKIHSGAAKYPLRIDDCPVGVEIYYDDRLVDYQLVAGQALVTPPHESQKVHICIKRRAPGTYGIVVKVNGINTVYKETFPAEQCTKWILEPACQEIKVEGYYTPDGNCAEFRSGSLQESREREMNYGADVGQVAITVYRERYVGPAPTVQLPRRTGDDAAEEAAIRDAPLPEDAASLPALKNQLLEGSNRGSRVRGLIFEGALKASDVRKVNFEPDPQPILNAIITYYVKTSS